MIDAHIHLCNEQVFPIREIFLQYACNNSIRYFLSCTASLVDFKRQDTVVDKDKTGKIKAFYGIHPWYVTDVKDDLRELIDTIGEKICSKRAIGIGEIGLDALKPNFPFQQKLFKAQAELATLLKVPFVIHNVKADEEVIEILRKTADLPPFMLHSFAGGIHKIKDYTDMGAYFSFSHRITRRKPEYIRQLMEKIPLERILIESDFDGKNGGIENYNITKTYGFVAEALKMDYKELQDIVDKNVQRFLNL